ncbi:tRNA (N(6)-L-threonylcarbamoyladenosine(37)-C(2))-methylthiotransferase MtaB [candidate division WS5 bacterium]|uniref:tRNA (N(6)-L-threonylcarbamoyladenosine(37)-C(2))-methylthiotransferase MtaB n=1 Tax=candidate division WS5 bacterium TaxID=2093353 RepID=A0A419DF90_9BACT|nr:MAG: tRNA (N(6)-L-threonylcarbamoyladenosine(37)-C(2))-methylthiotransferase MtaB [candidate division WS5 bacterium]
MKIFFITLGCRLNQAETEVLRIEASSKGFQLAKDEKSADIFIINSCSVTDKAQRDTEKLLKKLSGKYPGKELVITGCGARDEHKKYAVVVKNEEKGDLFSIFTNIPSCHSEWSEAEPRNPLKNNCIQDRERDSSALVGMTRGSRTRLMVKVQDGCNNFCSYCSVPYLRGREKSRKTEDIIKELQEAEKRGYKEVILCGVNIGRYSCLTRLNPVQGSTLQSKTLQSKKMNLVGLIQLILSETDIPRIRLSSINPDDFSDDLVDLWAKNDRLCPHFHISLQSGSDAVLKRMGRRYDTRQYSKLIAKLRKKIPEVQITTDIIVGFPGETQSEFQETVNFVKKTGFLKVHVFRYSPREGTRAAKMPDQISEKIKKERAIKLQKLEAEIRQEILRDYIGKEAEVLFEQGKNGHYSGFTSNYIKVLKKSQKDLTNQIIKLKIKAQDRDYLT